MAYETLLTTLKDGILTVTINRADKMNALNIALFGELKTVMEDVYKNHEIGGVIITGSGEKAFAAGADIAEFSNFSVAEGTEMSRNGHTVFDMIEQCPKPVIAAVNGFALGGGCELAMACHMRVASEKARFGQPEVNLGTFPGYGGTQRLPQLVGRGKALELLMTADMIKAPEAKELGLVNHVVVPEELMNKCEEILGKILSKGAITIHRTIELVNAYYDKNKDGFGLEIHEFGKNFDTQDFKEGTSAFLEKRAAKFTGK